MLGDLVTLGLLVLLQAVLGFDNLLYVSLESKRAPADRQVLVRRLGIGLAVVFRIVLLFALMRLIGYFRNPFLSLDVGGIVSGAFNFHSVIVLLGGAFILYTATREILHMMELEEVEHEKRPAQPVGRIVLSIVLMNLVFSFSRSTRS